MYKHATDVNLDYTMSNLWDKNFVANSRPRKPITERQLELTELLRLRTVSEIFFSVTSFVRRSITPRKSKRVY